MPHKKDKQMKHLIWIFVAAAITFSYTTRSGYSIKGKVGGAEGKKIVLKVYRNFKPTGIDSVKLKNGEFMLNGTVSCPEFCLLYVGDKGPLQFFIENSTIHITLDTDHIENSKITGSKENDLFQSFVSRLEGLAGQAKPLNDEYLALRVSANADPEKEKSLVAQLEKLQNERNAYVIDFVQKHPNTVVSAFIVDNMLLRSMDIALLEQISSSYDATLDGSQWVQMLKSYLADAKRTGIGQSFSDITLSAPDGKPMSLSDYAGKGKYLLVDFWASWCMPCRRANPQVVALYNQYKDKGFEIVGISLDRDKNEWIKAIENDQLVWPQMSDLKFWESEAAKLYSVSSIPYTILLDKDGNIIAKGLYADGLKEKLAELMD